MRRLPKAASERVSPGPLSRGEGSRLLLYRAVGALAGAGTMLIELIGPRLMQPWFGASVFVWTNVIGVILAAMASGYALGGRLSLRPGVECRIGVTLLLAGLFSAAVALGFGALAEAMLPDPVALAALGPVRSGLEVSSLAAAILLFAPPVFALATVAPQLVRAMVEAGLPAGRAAGSLSFWTTLGSLLGTFLPTYLLVPTIGSRTSLILAAVLLVAAGAATLLSGRRKGLALLVLALPLIPGLGRPEQPIRTALPGETIVREVESRYQYLRVVRAPAQGKDLDPNVDRELLLRINEGLQEFHSVTTEGRRDTGGKYYDLLACLPARCPQDRPIDVLVLGSGAGTLSRVLIETWGADRFGSIVDVEIDPAVLELTRLFDPQGKRASVRSFELDGRRFLRLCSQRFDLIYVDAYARQIDVPFHMATVEFFALAKRRLREDGCIALNVSGSDRQTALVRGIERSLIEGGFARPRMLPVPHWGNMALLAAADGAEPYPGTLVLPDTHLRGLWDAADRFRSEVSVDPGAPPFTDDFAPIEHLTQVWLKGS